MKKQDSFLVCVRCITYNHASYILDALKGFTNQETNFPYVCCIIDDASTDGESKVIWQYVHDNFDTEDVSNPRREETDDYTLIFAQHKVNKNCHFAVLFLKYNHYQLKKSKLQYIAEWDTRAKYIAQCEGDDYWIHPKKLQMQADFMETHLDYVMCHTDFDLSNHGHRNHSVYRSSDDNYFPYSVLHELRVGTATSFYRNEAFFRIPHLNEGKGWGMGDTPLWIELSHEGKIKFLPVITTCYRVLSDSASHGVFEKEIKFTNTAIKIHEYYAEYYGIELPEGGFGRGCYLTKLKIALKHKRADKAKEYYNEAKVKGVLTYKMRLFYLATCFRPMGWLLRNYLGY